MTRILISGLFCIAIASVAGCNGPLSNALDSAADASILASGATVVPPGSITLTRMEAIGDQISAFVSSKGTLPHRFRNCRCCRTVI